MDENFLARLFGSYSIKAKYGKVPQTESNQIPDGGAPKEDKSTNAHNCRKTAMLAKLFFIYKLTTRGFAAGIGKMYQEIFSEYAV